MTEICQTGVVHDPRYLDHRPAPGHPDAPGRLESIDRMLTQWNQASSLVRIQPRPATRAELLGVHSVAHLNHLEKSPDGSLRMLSADTQASPGSHEAALLAAGGLVAAIDQVVAGKLDNAFALVRPPGHHAERNRAMGYCFYNNVAIGASHARRTLGLERVLIVDWDVHHGNGTQHAFEKDSSVLVFSMHQYPHFPGTGHATETGIGPGEGFTVNVPMPRGCNDGDYADLMAGLLNPVARQFNPDLILVSAGFDSHRDDPLGQMTMTSQGFAVLTRILMELARDLCRNRLVLCLEGGYHHQALADSVQAVLGELAGVGDKIAPWTGNRKKSRRAAHVRKRVVSVQRRFWKGLAD